MIAAFGQYADTSWIPAKELDLEVNRWGIPLVDRDTWMTSRPGLFAGGDFTEGSRNLISAIADGRDAAAAINRYLGGAGYRPPSRPWRSSYPTSAAAWWTTTSRSPIRSSPRCRLQKRFSIATETETGYSAEEAITQARRCLQCQLNITIDPSICILCSGCVDICPYDCISMQGLTRVVKGDKLHELAGKRLGGRRRHDHRRGEVHPLRPLHRALPHRRDLDGAVRVAERQQPLERLEDPGH